MHSNEIAEQRLKRRVVERREKKSAKGGKGVSKALKIMERELE